MQSHPTTNRERLQCYIATATVRFRVDGTSIPAIWIGKNLSSDFYAGLQAVLAAPERKPVAEPAGHAAVRAAHARWSSSECVTFVSVEDDAQTFARRQHTTVTLRRTSAHARSARHTWGPRGSTRQPVRLKRANRPLRRFRATHLDR